MEEVKIISIKSDIFDRKRDLTFHPNFLEFDDNDRIDGNSTKFEKESIAKFKFGIKWINGYAFTFGRIYCIDIENNQGKQIEIRLKSFYGINLRSLSEKYAVIVDALQDYYFDDISRKYLNDFSNNIIFKINTIEYNNQGIIFENMSIPWEDLQTKNYRNYFSLSSKSDSNKYILIDYMNDWNGTVVYSVTRKILMDKGLFIQK
ncbi:hypothetical protein [Flavobacterium proteolyticum]|uniref:Uncharacterized protein n=1 Tax=Flavobacterium proteolyticum TaxID=2911683 RepID=A0ABR9WTP5_9FLAO|nr:hypothetical protein [Flavobacterium proteolyticum]MBE9577009.1 hypothetical protein [Flavobacterium proteolyticum]